MKSKPPSSRLNASTSKSGVAGPACTRCCARASACVRWSSSSCRWAPAGNSSATGAPGAGSPVELLICPRPPRLAATSALEDAERAFERIAQQVDLRPLDRQRRRNYDVRPREPEHRSALVGLAMDAGKLRRPARKGRTGALVRDQLDARHEADAAHITHDLKALHRVQPLEKIAAFPRGPGRNVLGL